MRRRSKLTAAIAVVFVASMAGCAERDDAGRRAAIVIDERAGTVNGASLGDDSDAIRQTLGAATTEGVLLRRTPDGIEVEDIGLPWTLDPIPGVRITRVLRMRYDDVTVDVAPDKGAYAFFVWRPGTRTTGGVRIGDRLESAERRYRGFHCGIRNRDSEYTPYPYCTGRVGETYVWFGQDPIRSITISSTPLG
jgi:hypothetical protein